MSNIVQEACQELGINQSELARKFKTTRSAVSRWNNGDIPVGIEIGLKLLIENHRLKKELSILDSFTNLLHKRSLNT